MEKKHKVLQKVLLLRSAAVGGDGGGSDSRIHFSTEAV